MSSDINPPDPSQLLGATAARSRPARPDRPSWVPSSSWLIVGGLVAGVLVGLFFGESAARLQPVADVYIRLMQMTVLPYLVLTLIGGLGQLDHATAGRVGGRAAALLGVLVLLTLLVVGLLPLAFPPLQGASSFYSDALIQPKAAFAISELYVPDNPFHALANAVVPAVVLFSTALGVALIGVPGKAPLLSILQALEQAVVRVTRFVLLLTPIGVFAITASVAGTMTPESLARLEVYLVAFALASVLMAFVVLPLAVSSVTPFGYVQVVTMCREALLTAFVASNAFIVLPMVVEKVKEALADRAMDSPDARSSVDIVVPILFVIPNAGKLLTLLFVPYAAWLAGSPMGFSGLVTLLAAGLPSYFAKAQVALPFLMDLVGVPHDLFQLYIASSIITGKLDSMVTVMSLLALSLMTACAVAGQMRLSLRRIVPALAGMAISTLAVVLLGRLLLAVSVNTTYNTDEALKRMYLQRDVVQAVVSKEAPEPDTLAGSALQRIAQRGVLRVGFVSDRVPFAFVNARGDLVGMDIELAGRLARDLGVQRVVFVPGNFNTIAQGLEQGRIDIAMGMPYLREILPRVAYSVPYLDSTLGLVVRDRDRERFSEAAWIRRQARVTIGLVVDSQEMQERLHEQLGGGNVQFVVMGSPRDFMAGKVPSVDAFAMLAEAGAAWSILYPTMSAVVPKPNPVAFPVGVAVRRGERELAGFVDDWLVIQRTSGALRQAREYWVLGRGAQVSKPRWSVLHDVLGWGKLPGSAAVQGTKH